MPQDAGTTLPISNRSSKCQPLIYLNLAQELEACNRDAILQKLIILRDKKPSLCQWTSNKIGSILAFTMSMLSEVAKATLLYALRKAGLPTKSSVSKN